MNKNSIEFNGENINARSILGINDSSIDAYGKQKIVQDYSIFSSLFTYGVEKNEWIIPDTGVTSENGTLVVQNAFLTSRRHIRYQPNRGIIFSTSVIFDNKSAAGTRRIGLFNTENGVFFELKDGILYGVVRSYYNLTVSEDRYIIDIKKLDLSKGNLFDIQYQWRGMGNFRFLINFEEVLVIEYLGTLDKVSISNPSLPIGVESNGPTLRIGCVDVSTEGGKFPRLTYGSIINASEKIVIVGGTPILSLRVKDMFKSRINTRDIHVLNAFLSSDKKTDFYIYYTRDNTALTGAVWDTNVDKSYDIDNSATGLNISKCSLLSFRALSTAGTSNIGTPPGIDFTIMHGDILIVYGIGANASCRAQFEIGEEI